MALKLLYYYKGHGIRIVVIQSSFSPTTFENRNDGEGFEADGTWRVSSKILERYWKSTRDSWSAQCLSILFTFLADVREGSCC